MRPELDHWLAKPTIRVAHHRESTASPEQLWDAARAVRLRDTRLLGRLVRLRIPGVPADRTFDELFREPPFVVLVEEPGQAVISGLVGRIWTLRRDYPKLRDPEEYRHWDTPGSARVLFANWIEGTTTGRAVLSSEARVEAIGLQGRLGVAAVRPLITTFHQLIGSEGIAAAVRDAERPKR